LSFGRKKTPGLVANASKKEEKKREKEKREGADILCDTSAHHNKNVPSRVDESSSRRRSETKFYQREREKTFLFFYATQKRGKGRQKRARVSVSFSF
jgi:hypothetical protein